MVKLACPLQETLSLWTSVRCIMRLLWCATPCLCWVTASTGTYWLRAKNTAGWDRSDTTIQVRIQNVIRATERTARTSFYSPFIFSLKTKMKSTSCDKKTKKKTLPVYVLHTFKVLCTHRAFFANPFSLLRPGTMVYLSNRSYAGVVQYLPADPLLSSPRDKTRCLSG